MIFGPEASPLVRILEGGLYIYLIPVLFDYLILDRSLKITQKSRLMMAAFLANAVSFLGLEAFFAVVHPFAFGIHLYPLLLVLVSATIKMLVYAKLLPGNSLRDIFYAVLFSTIIGKIVATILWRIIATMVVANPESASPAGLMQF